MKPDTLDLLADRVADRIMHRIGEMLDERPEAGYIDAAEVAQRFGVTREYVYAHAADLGAIRLGNGDKPRLRFHPPTVYERLAARPAPVAAPVRTTPRRQQPNSDLLPIKGDTP